MHNDYGFYAYIMIMGLCISVEYYAASIFKGLKWPKNKISLDFFIILFIGSSPVAFPLIWSTISYTWKEVSSESTIAIACCV